MEIKPVMVAIAAFIVITVIAAVLMPVLNDATETETTLTNEGYFKMEHFDTSGSHTVAWTYQKPSILTVDGEDVEVGFKVKNSNVTILADTNFLLRYYTNASGEGRALIYIPSTGNRVDALSDANQTASFTMTEGSMSGTISGTSVSSTYTDLYVVSKDGDYTMKMADKTAYLKGDSPVFGFGMTQLMTNAGTVQTSPGTGFKFVGDYDDGVTGTVWRGSNTTVSDVAMNATANNKYVDVYDFTSITAVATLTETVDGNSVTTDTDLTYSYVIIPAEITAEYSEHLSDNENAMLMVIPAMLIVAIIIGVLALAFRGRE